MVVKFFQLSVFFEFLEWEKNHNFPNPKDLRDHNRIEGIFSFNKNNFFFIIRFGTLFGTPKGIVKNKNLIINDLEGLLVVPPELEPMF